MRIFVRMKAKPNVGIIATCSDVWSWTRAPRVNRYANMDGNHLRIDLENNGELTFAEARALHGALGAALDTIDDLQEG